MNTDLPPIPISRWTGLPTTTTLPNDTRRHPIQGDNIDDLVNWQLLNGRGY